MSEREGGDDDVPGPFVRWIAVDEGQAVNVQDVKIRLLGQPNRLDMEPSTPLFLLQRRIGILGA